MDEQRFNSLELLIEHANFIDLVGFVVKYGQKIGLSSGSIDYIRNQFPEYYSRSFYNSNYHIRANVSLSSSSSPVKFLEEEKLNKSQQDVLLRIIEGRLNLSEGK